MKNNRYLFTSESVGEGHPDKLCDQISDAVLDECLRHDPESHVACETFASTALVLIGGEITTNTFVAVPQTARNIAREADREKDTYSKLKKAYDLLLENNTYGWNTRR